MDYSRQVPTHTHIYTHMYVCVYVCVCVCVCLVMKLRQLLLGRKAMTNLNSVLKCKDITLPTKVHIVNAMIFPLVKYGCELDHKEGWLPKNWCFQIVCWRRLLTVPWTSKRSNQSILKEINPEYSLEGLMLKLKLQDFGHLMWRANSLQKTLMLGKIVGKHIRGWGGTEMVGWHHWLNGREFEQGQEDHEEQGSLVCCSPWGHKELHTT